MIAVGVGAQQSVSEPVRISRSSEGKVVFLKLNQLFIVSLPVKLGTGFSWHFVDDNSVGLVVLKKVEIEEKTAEQTPGMLEVQSFTFAAVRSGKATLDFRLSMARQQSQADVVRIPLEIE